VKGKPAPEIIQARKAFSMGSNASSYGNNSDHSERKQENASNTQHGFHLAPPPRILASQ